LIARQKQVAGFYVPPRAVYSRQLAEVRALEDRVDRIIALNAREISATQKAGVARAEDARERVLVPPESADGKWTEHVNKENGMTFYHNALTNESTYNPPVGIKRGLVSRA